MSKYKIFQFDDMDENLMLVETKDLKKVLCTTNKTWYHLPNINSDDLDILNLKLQETKTKINCGDDLEKFLNEIGHNSSVHWIYEMYQDHEDLIYYDVDNRLFCNMLDEEFLYQFNYYDGYRWKSITKDQEQFEDIEISEKFIKVYSLFDEEGNYIEDDNYIENENSYHHIHYVLNSDSVDKFLVLKDNSRIKAEIMDIEELEIYFDELDKDIKNYLPELEALKNNSKLELIDTKIKGILSIVVSSDVSDYGNEATEEDIERYRQFLLKNTDCENIEIGLIESWEFEEWLEDEVDTDEIKNRLWERFCNGE